MTARKLVSVLVIYAVLINNLLAATINVEEYMRLRDEALAEEDSLTLGGDIVLTVREQEVNQILMQLKTREYKEGVDSNGEFFPTAKHFYHARDFIEASHVFKIIKMLPKGAALHLHEAGTGSVEYIINALTKWPNLYYCIGADNLLLFHFFPAQPTEPCFETRQWASVQNWREATEGSGYLEELFKKTFSMVTPTPAVDYTDSNRAWYFFQRKFDPIFGITNYVPALRAYYNHTLQEFLDDNVMYFEMRGVFDGVYNLDQSILSPSEIVGVYKEVTDEFVVQNPDFFGAKFIYAPPRFSAPEVIAEKLSTAVQIKLEYPSFFAGFDLVGHEEVGFPLLYYLEQLLEAAANNVKFYFHAGETTWHGTKIDENILDAVLLNTTRFGHGYALAAHPFLKKIAMEKGIAVECNPISNQVLRLVNDFRNHPATTLMTQGFPIVISSDDPGIFGSLPLSHDWYVAFMAMGGQRADLRFLKQLAINSIQYSSMDVVEKFLAMQKWNEKWALFLDNVIAQYSQHFVDNTIT